MIVSGGAGKSQNLALEARSETLKTKQTQSYQTSIRFRCKNIRFGKKGNTKISSNREKMPGATFTENNYVFWINKKKISVSCRRDTRRERKVLKTLSKSDVFKTEKMRKKLDQGGDSGAKTRNQSHHDTQRSL